MADNQTIAKGNVTISANADQMVKGLKDAENKASGFSKAMSQRGSAALTGFGAGMIGGGLAEVFKKGTEALVETVNKSREFEQSLERSAFLGNEISKSFGRVMDKIASSPEMLGEGDRAGRIQATDDAIKKLQTELEGFNRAAQVSRDRMTELNDALSKESWQLWLGGGLKNEMEGVKQQLDQALERISKTNEQLAKLREQSRNLKNPHDDPANIKARTQAFEDLNRQIDEVGKSERQLRLEEFTKNAPSESEIKRYDRELQELERRKMEDEANKVFKPQRLGILETALQAYDIVKEQVSNMKPEKAGPMFAEAIEKGSAQAYSMDVANRYGFDTTDAAATQRELLAQAKRQADAAERAFEEMRTLNNTIAEGTV